MISKKELVEEENKSFDGEYIYCDQCEWNGIPNQMIVRVYLGIRPSAEPGFIYKFETYDYPIGIRKKLHVHKYHKKIMGQLLDEMLNRTWWCS
jgi:hypothetical protein